MEWGQSLNKIEWSQKISNYEEKCKVAQKIASFVKDGDVIGFGSGSTAFLAVQEIAKRVKEEKLSITAIPTSNEIRMTCIALGIPVAELNDVRPDWGFDGADEVDPNNWLIKGRGGAMFNEKLIMSNAEKTYIIVDQSKFVKRLGEKFPVPVECVPASYISVMNQLYLLGAENVHLRLAGTSKDGPVLTESGNYILDTTFSRITEDMEAKIKGIVGVLESGLFIGYPIEVISV